MTAPVDELYQRAAQLDRAYGQLARVYPPARPARRDFRRAAKQGLNEDAILYFTRRHRSLVRACNALDPHANVGQLFWTPALVQDYLRQTNEHFEGFDRDMHAHRAAGKVDDPTWMNWASFLAGWRAFYDEHRGGWSEYWSTGGVVDVAEQWRRDLIDWRKRMVKAGMRPRSMAPKAADRTPLFTFSSGAAVGAFILMGGLLLWALKGGVRK